MTAANMKCIGHVSDLAPFYEADSTWEVDKPSPTIKVKVSKLHHKMGWRVFNTHLWWRYLPKHQEARHQLKVGSETEPIVSSTFAEFHERFVDGSMPYGKWVDHIMSFDAARTELKTIQIVNFLGISISENTMKARVETFSFSWMKQRIERSFHSSKALFQNIKYTYLCIYSYMYICISSSFSSTSFHFL
eukprot:jgi/Bigna1/89564/estExt_fgenesh1_pg.C_510125